MQFKNKLKRKRIIDKYVQRIKLMFQKTFYSYLYKSIINDFTYNDKVYVRYYETMVRNNDESVELELLKYHNGYISYNDEMLRKIFLFTSTYIQYKLKSYTDLYFILGEDEHGNYFEIGYKEEEFYN